MISTRDLSGLSGIDELRALLQAMAMLDAILCREWEFRFYSFNCRWAEGEQMGSMRNGQGDDFFALFNDAGCFLKGFAHEAPLTPYRDESRQLWPGLLDGVPQEFAACLREPAFSMQDITFCIWRRYSDPAWRMGPVTLPEHEDPDGSAFLLSPLDGNPETYRAWAEWYFDTPFLTVEMVRHVYEHRPLTDEVMRFLTQDVDMEGGSPPYLTKEDFEEDIEEIGYPA